MRISLSWSSRMAVLLLNLSLSVVPAKSQFIEISLDSEFEKPGAFTMPTSLSYDSYRHRLAVADNAKNLIYVYGLSDNSEEILGRDFELDKPQSLCFGSRGELYATLSGSPLLLKFNMDLEFPDTNALQITDEISSLFFSDISVDKFNRIQLADRRFGIALIADTSGTILMTIKEYLRSPGGIQTGANDNIYIADKGNDPVLIFSAEGEYIRKLSPPEPLSQKPVIAASGIAFDRLGWIYTLDITNSKLIAYDPTGLNQIVWAPELAPFFPVDIAIDRNDNIYILESGLGHVRVIKRSD